MEFLQSVIVKLDGHIEGGFANNLHIPKKHKTRRSGSYVTD